MITRKRKSTSTGSEPVSKERRLKEPTRLEPVRASATRNYLIKDPLLDWFNLYGRQEQRQSDQESFASYLMQQGHAFEEGVVALLREKFGSSFVDITTHSKATWRAETVKAIRRRVPIIYQGELFHEATATGGQPDLLVRSDYLKQLVDNPPAVANSNRHYVVVDIKFTTLCLRADGLHLLNAGSVPAFKGQLYIYHRALKALQRHSGSEAYILGRRWNYVTCGQAYSGDGCFDRLGHIDFAGVDANVPALTDQAVEWLREVRANGATWNPLKPHRIELYPNMSNKADWPWSRAKQELVEQTKDVTALWMCGPKNRLIAHRNGFKRYDDPDLTPEDLGVHGEYTSEVLEAILDVNRVDHEEPIRIGSEVFIPSARREVYFDFETLNDVNDDFQALPASLGGGPFIFMIGCGYRVRKRWVYKSFTVKALTRQEEERICLAFVRWLKSLKGDINLYHWSHHEQTCWRHATNRYDEVERLWSGLDVEWVDLLKIFRQGPITVKGALGFSLKQVVKAMHAHGLIETCYDYTDVADGADAMLLMLRAARVRGLLSKTPEVSELLRYNEVDCKVMLEIVEYLRNC